MEPEVKYLFAYMQLEVSYPPMFSCIYIFKEPGRGVFARVESRKASLTWSQRGSKAKFMALGV